MNKLVVTIMGQNCEKFLPMCLESIKDADAIIYCDGGSTDNTLHIVNKFEDSSRRAPFSISNPYDQEDKAMNGKQRNFYLDYVKKNYPNDWCLVLDADEVVEDLSKVRAFIKEAQPGIYSPRMRHFIGDLSKEDAIQPAHYVLNRLFKISEAGEYPETEHPVLQIKKHENDDLYYYGNISALVIWHLGYINGIFDINKKYHNHLRKSQMHTAEYLYQWNMAHIMGNYPTSPVNPSDIPRIILDNFGIEKDIFYFQDRMLKVHHFDMVRDWMIYYAPKTILDIGCGFGNYGYVFKKFYGVQYKGVDISKFAVNSNPYDLDLVQGDIKIYKSVYTYDLVLVLDILEHLKEEELDMALENIKQFGNDFIFSIPFIGDSNLYKDTSHRIFKSKEWWTQKLGQYFQIRDSPENWLFHNQLLIGKRVNTVNQNSIVSPVTIEGIAQKNVQQEI